MTDNTDSGLELPPELALLDRELSSITIEERPSFAPELEAELEREWASPVLERRTFRPAYAVAAALGALMIVGLSAPARASIARLLNVGEDAERAAAAMDVAVPARPSAVPLVELDQEEAPALDRATTFESSDEARSTFVMTLPRRFPLEVVFPELLNREEHQQSITERFPSELAEAGLGGTVQIRLWVNLSGGVEYVQVAETSGIEALDRFAIEVAADLRFTPARRAGMGVGAWVELPLVFEARSQDDEDPDRPGMFESPVLPIDSVIR